MLVSIVISNYNYGAYVAAAIDSALAQTYAEVEVVVVDDGSTDSSVERIRGYEDRARVHLAAHAGQLATVNAGYAHCRGDAVIFLDSDDLLFPDAVARHVENLRRPGVVKSHGYLQIIDRAGVPTGGRVPASISPPGDYRERFLKYGPRAYRGSFTSGNAWRRDFLEQVMPLPEMRMGLLGPDGYLSALDPLFGRIEVLDEPVGQYRVHDLNTGPLGYRFDAHYLRQRLVGYEARVAYTAEKARSLGYAVDPEGWVRRAGWKHTLLMHLLHVWGDEERRVPALQLLLAPFREPDAVPAKAAVRALQLALIRALPAPLALRLGKRTCDGCWGRASARV